MVSHVVLSGVSVRLKKERCCYVTMQKIFIHPAAHSVSCCLLSLTHTPRKTSGRGWTLVNVGLTMAIAILDEKWVRGEKMIFYKNEGGTLF